MRDKIEDMEFMECLTCVEKPGTPTLCNPCYQNRKTISELKAMVVNAQREPGVYRVGYTDERLAIVAWNGASWVDPLDGEAIPEPCTIIERVEAKVEKPKMSVMDHLKRSANGFGPDWNNGSEKKFPVIYDHDSEGWVVGSAYVYQIPGVVYFQSEKEAIAAIDELGEELLK